MGDTITQICLPPNAEVTRKRIKWMLPEAGVGDSSGQESEKEKAERLPTQIKGGVMYGGPVLAKRISDLVKEMGLEDIVKHWIWTVAHFYEGQPIRNDSSQMYLIPLSENSMSSPTTIEGLLEEGHYAFIRGQPILSAGASVIFITPPITLPVLSRS